MIIKARVVDLAEIPYFIVCSEGETLRVNLGLANVKFCSQTSWN